MRLSFNPLVQKDLRAVLDYYETEGGSLLADRFFAEVEALIRNIEISPERFHPAQKGLRKANLESFPYHFLYRTNTTGTRILVLRHHRRHPFHGIRRK